MGWLWLVGSIKLYASFAKEPYKRDDILQKRPIILSILLTVATPYVYIIVCFIGLSYIQGTQHTFVHTTHISQMCVVCPGYLY